MGRHHRDDQYDDETTPPTLPDNDDWVDLTEYEEVRFDLRREWVDSTEYEGVRFYLRGFELRHMVRGALGEVLRHMHIRTGHFPAIAVPTVVTHGSVTGGDVEPDAYETVTTDTDDWVDSTEYESVAENPYDSFEAQRGQD